MKPEWFERWFGEEYLALYPHRDAKDAERAVDLIETTIGEARVARVLDLACGAGRHSKLLCDRWWTAGLDLSEVLLRLARREGVDAPLVRGDMRVLPFRDRSFSLVVNLFTSFGYFADDDSSFRVVREVSRVTERDGTFVLDFLNTTRLRRTLVPYDERQVGGDVVEQRREISEDGKFVIKRICVRGRAQEFTERVRLFEVGDLAGMMNAAGFKVSATYGSYAGAALTPDSPRAIIFGTKP